MITLRVRNGHSIRFLLNRTSDENRLLGMGQCQRCGAFGFVVCGHAGKEHEQESLEAHVLDLVERFETIVCVPKEHIDAEEDWTGERRPIKEEAPPRDLH